MEPYLIESIDGDMERLSKPGVVVRVMTGEDEWHAGQPAGHQTDQGREKEVRVNHPNSQTADRAHKREQCGEESCP